MLKKILAASVALAALAGSSYADPTIATVTLTGTVTTSCEVTGLDGTTVAFGTIVLDGNGKVDGSNAANSQSPSQGKIVCNGTGSSVSVQAIPLHISATATGFTNVIPYVLKTKLDAPADSFDSGGDAVSGTTKLDSIFGANSVNNVIQKITLDSTTSPVLGGSYSGSIVFTVTPG